MHKVRSMRANPCSKFPKSYGNPLQKIKGHYGMWHVHLSEERAWKWWRVKEREGVFAQCLFIQPTLCSGGHWHTDFIHLSLSLPLLSLGSNNDDIYLHCRWHKGHSSTLHMQCLPAQVQEHTPSITSSFFMNPSCLPVSVICLACCCLLCQNKG